ncbi:hypothetical protein CCYA_CCYA18G4588 [Cyanidiococcus yangmingshanensis]|uniref:Centromere protein S n=1 Tax=Cyanidiococcus yangmingshanensis TaxID=2690220 RepID=A0A7J7IE01_9RHOD|nr:hypothetical protein F1559_002939 [Cyanidiococcus yangmingshanensis]KAK4533706.1 hypothetical protein CCYA_CCYA18G4588 [Cyanidiococcus yangmingshanensis]
MPKGNQPPEEEEASPLPEQQQTLELVLRLAEDLEQRHAGKVHFEDNALLAIAELVWGYIMRSMVPDLVAFARHAKRQRIMTADVMLCARRNPDLLRELEEELKQSNRETEVELALETPGNRPPPESSLF